MTPATLYFSISVNCFSWAQINNIVLHFSKFKLQVNEAIVLEPESNLLFLFINFFFLHWLKFKNVN